MEYTRVCESAAPHGGLQFSILTNGWVGSGFKSKYQKISCRYINHPDRGGEAHLGIEITNHYEKRSQTMVGEICLTATQAIELAKRIVPKHIADAIDAAHKGN